MKDDMEFEDMVITEVRPGKDGCEILCGSTGFWAPRIEGHEPKAGMKARFYGKGFGYSVRGLVIDGEVYFYRSQTQQKSHEAMQVAEYRVAQRKKFEENKQRMDAAYNDLPPEFKRRIDRFRRGCVGFRWQYEDYELMVCTDAVIIGTTLKSPEAVEVWRKLDYESQRAQVAFSEDHSGNSFGCAVMLAYNWLKDRGSVEFLHGALTPLVGCDAYGCTHPEKQRPRRALNTGGDSSELNRKNLISMWP